MPNLVISTCGTSILTNGADATLRSRLTDTANAREADLAPDARREIDALAQARQRAVLAAGPNDLKQLSAELNGLVRFYGGDLRQAPRQAPDHHVLLHTDTAQGRWVARIVGERLHAAGFATSQLTAAGLTTADLGSFRVALADLTQQLLELVPNYRAAGYRTVFNLTGGFKSVNGFLQTLAMFYGDEAIYVFEGAEPALLHVPRLPVRLDPEGVVGDNLATFRRLAICRELPVAECEAIPETLLMRIGDRVALSEWGELVWADVKARFYRSELLPPPTDAVRLTDGFTKAARDLPPDRLANLNTRLDELAGHLLDGRNPKSLSLKPLKGEPVPACTHEFYAWSDRDAKRCYGRFDDDGDFTVVMLGAHL